MVVRIWIPHANFLRRARDGARPILTASCKVLLQLQLTHAFNRFGGITSVEELYVEEMHNVLVDLDCDVDKAVKIILDAYPLSAVSFLHPVGRDVF